ncbi:hypothetical protein CRM22_009429 [Opisthorchis felineus]|uniref:L-serine deaminase n=1 Tax=Opisthorchis felineus TaxID=147828 RepID=A0A4S2LDW4_OPIFE|nr:hypothetical protein CRM22_009429 [Opisthorchis felineus]
MTVKTLQSAGILFSFKKLQNGPVSLIMYQVTENGCCSPNVSDCEEKQTEWKHKPITDIPIPDANDPDVFDPDCDAHNPVAVTYQDVSAAYYRIRDGIIRTPCKKSQLSKIYNMNIFLKLELQQVTGSFKERGARNFLLQLTPEQAKRGVIASSAGNHGQALAYHGKNLNIPVTIVMPVFAPLMKVENCLSHGANVILKGADMSQAKPYALKVAKINDIRYVNGYDHPQILAGQGSVALEIMEQVPTVDAILVPVGGGGLLAGIAVAVKGINPKVQVIGVESDQCAGFGRSMQAGEVTYTACSSTVADGLAVPLVGVNSLHTCLGLVDKMITVEESHIHRAIIRLLEVEKCVAEGAGATALAAILAGYLPELEGKTVVPIISGGNIDTTILGRVIDRGLTLEGRLCRFLVVVSDRPGGIAEMCCMLRDLGVSSSRGTHESPTTYLFMFSTVSKTYSTNESG